MTNTLAPAATSTYAVRYRRRSDSVDLHRPTVGQVPTWTVMVPGTHADAARLVNQGRDVQGFRLRAVTIRLVDGSPSDWDAQQHRDVASGHVVPWLGCCSRMGC